MTNTPITTPITAPEKATRIECLNAIRAYNGHSNFIRSVSSQLLTRGKITDRQMDAAYSAIWRETTEAAVPTASGTPATISTDSEMFEALVTLLTAACETQANVRILLSDQPTALTVALKPVKHSERYAAHLLLDDTWVCGLLKDKDAGFSGTRGWFQTLEPHREALLRIAAQPLQQAAIHYGKLTGQCSICARTLTDPKSIEAGIGPICAEKF